MQRDCLASGHAPPTPVNVNHTYAFVGLTPSERSLLESIFALDADDDPAEALVPAGLGDGSGHGPDLLIVNGDDLAVADRLGAAYPHALIVLVGQPRATLSVRWPVMRRPLNLQGAIAVLSELDWPAPAPGRTMAPAPARSTATAAPAATPAHGSGHGAASPGARPSTAFASEPPSSAFAPTTASAPLSAGGAPRASEPLSARLAWAMSEVGSAHVVTATRAEARPKLRPIAPEAPARPTEVLVVHGRHDGQSPTLARGLRRMGYAVKTLDSADEALAVLEHQSVPFVFLDQRSLGAQLLPLARALNALRSAPTQPPHLAIVARDGSAFDRLRARMAGCAWMREPVDRERLMDYLERRGLPRPRGGTSAR